MSNSLATVHPELIVEWSDRNLPLTPDSVTFGSNKKVWWKGACGHEWETSIKARSSGEKCPICSGARVIEGINDLSTLKPELASAWSEKNEIKPTEVSIGSHKKVIWKCKLEHEWIATVKEHLCKQRRIKLIKLPMNPNEAEPEYAQRIKAAFQNVHIFISSDTEEDVKIIRKIFKNWRNSR